VLDTAATCPGRRRRRGPVGGDAHLRRSVCPEQCDGSAPADDERQHHGDDPSTHLTTVATRLGRGRAVGRTPGKLPEVINMAAWLRALREPVAGHLDGRSTLTVGQFVDDEPWFMSVSGSCSL